PAEAAERRLPDSPRRGRIGEIARDQFIASACGMTRDIVAGGLEQGISRRANAAARSSDEDVHGAQLAHPPQNGEGDHSPKSEWWRGRRAGLQPPSASATRCHLPAERGGFF